MKGTVYTIGYTGRTVEEIIQTAELTDAVVLDIRFNPRSRVPHWNKGPLSRALGARYVHLDALGNVNYRGDGPIQIKDPEAGVKAVEELIDAGRDVILMCVCKDLRTCHRLTVAELLTQRLGCEVQHVEHSVAKSSQGKLF